MIRNRMHKLTLTLVALLLFGGLPASLFAESTVAEGSSYQSQAENPLAIVKKGFLVEMKNRRFTFMPLDSSKRYSYLLADNYVVVYKGEAYPNSSLSPWAVVEIVLIEGQVVEIIHLTGPS